MDTRTDDLHVAGGEQTGPHRNRPARWGRLLHRVTSARRGQQSSHRHRARGSPLLRRVHADRRLIQTLPRLLATERDSPRNRGRRGARSPPAPPGACGARARARAGAAARAAGMLGDRRRIDLGDPLLAREKHDLADEVQITEIVDGARVVRTERAWTASDRGQVQSVADAWWRTCESALSTSGVMSNEPSKPVTSKTFKTLGRSPAITRPSPATSLRS